MYITRDLEGALTEALRGGKVVILYGSRQTGKTTLIERLLADDEIRRGGVVTLSGDVREERELLAYETMTPEKAQSIVGEARTLFVDEAQKIRAAKAELEEEKERLSKMRTEAEAVKAERVKELESPGEEVSLVAVYRSPLELFHREEHPARIIREVPEDRADEYCAD